MEKRNASLWLQIGCGILLAFLVSVVVFELMSDNDRGSEVTYEFITEDPVGNFEYTTKVTVERVIQPRDVDECKIARDQHNVIKFSYDYGVAEDFGYTMAAIALKESNAGRWKVNIQDPSGGIYHVTLDKVLRDRGWEDTPFNRNRAMQVLVDNDEYAAELALRELKFWREYNSGRWLDMWASYNAGTNGNMSTRGIAYAEDIRQLIQKIQYCGWV